MNNSLFKALLVGLFFFATMPICDAKTPKVKWQQGEISTAVSHAKKMFRSNNLPSSATDLRVFINISVDNGTVVKRVSTISYLPTFTKAHDDGTKTIYWDDATSDLTIIEASVVLPDGNSVRMNPDNIRVRTSDEYNTFTNDKEVVIPLSGVESGSMIVMEYEKKTKLESLESLYSETIYPAAFSRDVSSFALVFEHDDSLNINWNNDSNALKCDYAEGKLNCIGSNIKKLPYESTMSWRDELPSIVIAQKANWEQVVAYVKTAFNKSNYDSKDVHDFAEKLTNDVDTMDKKIARLHSYASRSIRYVSMSELGHRITPHNFNDVVDNLFGDCKDKSALLVGMLNAIGIDAFPVLVATERRNPEKIIVPSSNYFDHMVVCFDLDGKRYCLDPTNTYTSWHTPASWIQGRVSLELRDTAKPNNIRLDEYKWVLKSRTSMVFDNSANVMESQSRIFSGAYAGHMREGLLSYNKEKRNDWLLKNYQDNISTLTEPDFEIKHLESQSSELLIHSNANYKPYYDAAQALYLTEYDSWIRAELGGYKLAAENYGSWIDGSFISSEMTYDFGELWQVRRLPASLEFQNDVASLERTIRKLGDEKLVVRTELRIKSRYIEPNEIESHNEMIDVLLAASNIRIEGALKE